ncbi:MAG: hypothetical protein V1894_02270 [Chloroflexota bacterium]
MRRGCISIGEIKCDSCGRMVVSAERYLATDVDKKGKEVASGGKTVRYCIDCSLKKGLAGYREEKGEKVLTFFFEKETAR